MADARNLALHGKEFSAMSELHKTLYQLTLAQHLLALVFLLSYGTALGSMFGPAGRLRALAMALLAAAGFAALTHPWEQGVLLVVCAIGAIGLFIAVAWAFSAIAASDRWASGTQAPMRSRGSSPELRDAATRAVARAAHQVKRRRHHRTT
ncbi:MAG: hypothetical protein CFE40_08035 [Burkholderiales bacterium PBB1]|nr:MAG: hypothetical protein CFE40_08035 [Burkholderiales bacterium PBB1]